MVSDPDVALTLGQRSVRIRPIRPIRRPVDRAVGGDC
jgi:hypothetical protein